ncbi:MAG TPA: hypothetical protein VN853_04405 [Polyangia bacterium]|nr:hypothetical protein [Polyangia bacterium]
MSIEPRALPTAAMAPEAPESIATLDLFALGRRAAAARDGRLGRRGSFVRARQLLANGSWRGPRDAAESYLDDADLAAIGGLSAAAAAGVDLLVAGAFSAEVQAAAEAGIRVLLRLPYRVGESDGERTSRLTVVGGIGWNVWGVMPAPAGEPYGLDTLRFYALCRLALPKVPHLLADVGALGPRLAQMVFGFGADELYAPIVAERALRLGANAHNPALTRKEAATLIRGAGLVACERFADGTLEEVS